MTIALDGVVLNDANSQGIDLSLLPPALLERADIYRGTAPVRLGIAGLGGTIELFTRTPGTNPVAWVSAGYGSFHQRRASTVVTAQARNVRTLIAIGYRGTQGNFPFYDDRGTDLWTGDDRISVRTNNSGNALDALFRGCVGPLHTGACVLLTTTWRRRGMPGPGSQQFEHPSLSQARWLGRGSYRARIGTGWIEGYASLIARTDRFLDPSATVVPGLIIDARSGGLATETGIHGELRTADVRLEPVLRARYEWFHTEGALGGILSAQRTSILAGTDVTLTHRTVQVAPALALEAMRDQALSTTDNEVLRMLISPRLGARIEVRPGFELRGNVSHLERAPTLPELFGVAYFLLGNPALVPETSDNLDAGVVGHWRTHGWQFRLEGAAFARNARNLIVLERRGVLSLKPFNLRRADIAGFEAIARLSHRGRWGLTVSYAHTQALTRAPGTPADGRWVPSIPAHDLFARLEATLGPLQAWSDLSFVSGIYFDQANQTAAPPRLLLSAAVSFTLPFARALTATLMGTNLLDQRDAVVTVHRGDTYDIRQPIADFAGYPLPGRAVFVSMTVATESRQ
uniref:TonB-dependent receptor n=1 Tax=uncultured delta proteobacterium TaxID=34034 RepID=H5SJF8_9DELT|nr:TonB-dependent receptor [uncultured delta proteobacterium]